MADVIALTYDISPDDFTRAGEASSDVKSKLKTGWGFPGGDPEGGYRHV